MRYPHPVLVNGSDDYERGRFDVELRRVDADDGHIELRSTIAVQQPGIESLLSTGLAAVGYFLICRRTFLDRLIECEIGENLLRMPLSNLYGTVQVRPVIWARALVSSHQDDAIHEEFGMEVTIPKGGLLALGPEFRFSVDPARFKPLEALFQLEQSDMVAPGEIEVSPGESHVTIGLAPQTYESVALARNTAAGRGILISSVYLPALVETVTLLQQSQEQFEGSAWSRILRAKCDDLGLALTDSAHSALRIAQRLLNRPISQTLAVVERIQS